MVQWPSGPVEIGKFRWLLWSCPPGRCWQYPGVGQGLPSSRIVKRGPPLPPPHSQRNLKFCENLEKHRTCPSVWVGKTAIGCKGIWIFSALLKSRHNITWDSFSLLLNIQYSGCCRCCRCLAVSTDANSGRPNRKTRLADGEGEIVAPIPHLHLGIPHLHLSIPLPSPFSTWKIRT